MTARAGIVAVALVALLGAEGSTVTPPPDPRSTADVGAEPAPAAPRPPRRRLNRADSSHRLLPSDLVYLGAIRLPDTGGSPPHTFEYGGQAMTYRPTGDPQGGADGFPGSLFVAGIDTVHFVAEVAIPKPVVSATKDLDALPVAHLLQPLADVRGGLWPALTEIPRAGLLWLSRPETGERLHLCYGQHFQQDESTVVPSHAWLGTDLSAPGTQGAWWVGDESLYSVNGYLFEIPDEWAATHTGGRSVGTGRFRDGGWSGMGPALFAVAPWHHGVPPPAGTRLQSVRLLRYRDSTEAGPEQASVRLNTYQHPDEWEGGAWLTAADGRSAVVFVGTKGTGSVYWYGWINPAGADVPCVESEGTGMVGCHWADGTTCPPAMIRECAGHTSDRGWWSARFDAQMVFFDPDELASVAGGTSQPHEPQPYAVLDIDDALFLPDPPVDPDAVGRGAQRRFRVGEMAYDRERGRLFVCERLADGARPLIHVWQLR
ncbi:MAG: hypothetical protein AB1625_14440 [Acidobacteriota bacterium]